MKINVDLNLGTDFRRAAALAICFTLFLPLATGIVIAIASQTTVPTHGVFGYVTVPLAIWLYGVIFQPWLHKYPWQWIFALGGATGLVAGLIRGAFGGAVCHPIPGDVFAPASFTPLWYCSISSALLGALCAPLFFAFGTARVAEAEATGTWKEPSTAPHQEL